MKVTGVDTKVKTLSLQGRENIHYDHLVLATGGVPRTIATPGSDLDNILYLRSPQDANRIVTEARGRKVVIVGNSFIGTEVAAFLADKAESVTLIGRTKYPLERSLGPEIGKLILKMHEAKGVRFINEANVISFEGNADQRVSSVMVDTIEEAIPADLVVVGIGCVPATQFLQNSDLHLDSDGFVEVNQYLESNVENVYAIGDIAKFPLDQHSVAIGHWQIAQSHGRCAGLNVALKSDDHRQVIKTVPFFWTVQYGKSLRYAGHCPNGWDEIIYEGQPSSGSFCAYYCFEDFVEAIATLGRDPIAADFANLLKSGQRLSKKDAVAGVWHRNSL